MKTLSLVVAVLVGCGGGGGGNDGPDGGVAGEDAPSVVDEPRCGDGHLDVMNGEACDDGNIVGGDGCTADCSQIEDGHACGNPGDPCVVTHVCGNGLVEDSEACDNHNTTNGDGCHDDCTLEPGWKCDTAGIRCSAAACGDGIVAGFEECDDANAATPGCSATCTLEAGFQCLVPGASCTATVCGNGIKEGTEQCDDGSAAGPDNNLGDGCTPLCTNEPQCVDGTCTAVCGDGAIQIGEECDDGNLHDFDGCSSSCKVELGFYCTPSTTVEPMTIDVPIVYRDFKGNDLAGGHVDFQNINKSQTGMVTGQLVNNKPQLIDTADYGTAHTSIKNRSTFAQWYTDDTLAKTVVATLPMTRIDVGTYEYDNGNFFPVDGIGWQDATKVPAGELEPSRDNSHNFSFTSELRYWFKWNGTENLKFRGDDDVWVFVNGKLAVDLGGVHGAQNANITLDDATNTAKSLGLTLGGTYEVAVFQAERHTTASSYKLTLKGFNTQKSVCDDLCGDGLTSSQEQCDDGTNMGDYNSCTATCGFGPRCGDGIVQPEEECDNGTTLNTGGYGKCKPTCELGPRCGDGVIQAGESCDDGNTTDGDGCPANCQTIVL